MIHSEPGGRLLRRDRLRHPSDHHADDPSTQHRCKWCGRSVRRYPARHRCIQYFPSGPEPLVDCYCRSQSLGTFITLISVPWTLSVGCWQDAATTGYRRTLDILAGPVLPALQWTARWISTSIGYRRWPLHQKNHPGASFHPGIKNPSFPAIRRHSHKTEAYTRTFSTPPLEPFSGMPPTGFSLSAPAFLESSRGRRLAVYASAVYIAPPTDTRHCFDQPILVSYDNHILDVQAFVIDTAANQSLPILKMSAADPTDDFYADRQIDWETESTFNGGRVFSRHLQMRERRSFLSEIFNIMLLLVN